MVPAAPANQLQLGRPRGNRSPRNEEDIVAPASQRPPVIHEGLPTQLPDIDPDETTEWVESLDDLISERGRDRARYVMLRLLERARERNVGVPALRSTDYINTIPPEREPWFPGNEDIERRIRAFIRWNAAVMVSRANRPGLGVGGHIATYQSAASLYEVGFNHFFRGKQHSGGGDQIFIPRDVDKAPWKVTSGPARNTDDVVKNAARFLDRDLVGVLDDVVGVPGGP